MPNAHMCIGFAYRQMNREKTSVFATFEILTHPRAHIESQLTVAAVDMMLVVKQAV